MYRIKLTRRAKKELKEIKPLYQEAIEVALQEIKEDPLTGKPLTRELTGKFSYKVSVYRIVYKIREKDKIVYILTVGHRSMVYQ